MAAEVSSLIRILNAADSNDSGKSTALITRDLLGGGCPLDSKELDLDMQVPSGWEKRLDLKSGKVYLQRCDPQKASASTSDQKKQNDRTSSKLQDLNFPPAAKQPMDLFDDGSLDLKLVPSSSASASAAPSSNYQSVCTLDKVKSALERAEKETFRKRSISMSKSSSPPSNSSSSIKDGEVGDEEKSATSFAAGCPSCLLYVLISTKNPECPRCNAIVPLPSPSTVKKPRIDLNISI
ncbi:uncharacterized protein LOC113770570 [Coffea eugenioides]|uniref:GIR1-like zinc ribbon domain-containing protein n=1 Tax=Coffea arabica TaxID=13443 RepID=A0A6P6XJF0_COFAR|nr:uncharacterized protein LOC113743490 [Coffea arabica]XP_027170873.1 uncharacterized protein LOC113770570 [Coffea eugenioides]